MIICSSNNGTDVYMINVNLLLFGNVVIVNPEESLAGPREQLVARVWSSFERCRHYDLIIVHFLYNDCSIINICIFILMVARVFSSYERARETWFKNPLVQLCQLMFTAVFHTHTLITIYHLFWNWNLPAGRCQCADVFVFVVVFVSVFVFVFVFDWFLCFEIGTC